MLLWRPSERNKYIFLLELVVISTVAHLIWGLCLFVVYRGGTTSFRVELGKSHNPTLFMPLKKQVGTSHGCTGRKGHGPACSSARGRGAKKSSSATDVPQYCNDCKGVMHVAQSRQQKESHHFGSSMTMGWDAASAKIRGAKTSSVHEKKSCKKNKKKGRIKKRQTTKSTKPIRKLKQELPSVIEPVAEKKIEQIQAKPLEPAAKIEEIVQELQSSEVALTRPDELSAPEVSGASEQEFASDYGLDEITLGQECNGEYITAEQARMYECIEQEIVSRWRPPCGLAKDLSCQIKCSIGGNGTVVACKIEKSSGVLIYDMAARSAARAMTLDRWAWGKEFTIIFKQ